MRDECAASIADATDICDSPSACRADAAAAETAATAEAETADADTDAAEAAGSPDHLFSISLNDGR